MGLFDEVRCEYRLPDPAHQDLRICESVEVGPEEREWVEYVARFTEDRVTRVRRTPDRGRFKVKTRDPEALPKPDALTVVTPDAGAAGPSSGPLVSWARSCGAARLRPRGGPWVRRRLGARRGRYRD